jgi:2-oxoglutarate ferredoxin oxidoreductase subunit alpha
MKQKILRLKIAGQAGQGVKSAGLMFARFASRSGYNIFNYIEYPSIIRGGHNVMQISISEKEVQGPSNTTDLLIALNQDSLDMHVDEFVKGSCVIFDSGAKLDTSPVEGKAELVGVPLGELARESGGKDLLINTVALGAAATILGGDLKVLKGLVDDEYGDKGEEVINSNIKAIESGGKYVTDNYKDLVKDALNFDSSKGTALKKMVLNGDEAAALGAIAAGVQFASIYPMSPISNVLHTLAAHQEEFDYVYKQPEDEIAAINMAIGASFAGARSMTATSGGGFALMGEGFGLAGMVETPVVIVEGQRGSPGTGIPTWSEQGDLRMVMHSHQGDFPRIILAPGDAIETFYMTMEAFYIADKYQTPVVVLIDKNICDNDQSTPIFDVSAYRVDRGKFTMEKVYDYKIYELTDDGISLRSIPGSGNFFIANSDEHDAIGYSSEEIKNRNDQMNKRMKKLETCALQDMPEPMLYGPEDADLTIVSWGSSKGSILDVIKNYDNVNFLQVTWMNPFPTEAVTKILEKAKKVLHVEANYTGQLAGIIREKTGIEIENKFLKFDGRPFYVEEIEEKIKSMLKGGTK